jgi:hypothetical protein
MESTHSMSGRWYLLSGGKEILSVRNMISDSLLHDVPYVFRTKRWLIFRSRCIVNPCVGGDLCVATMYMHDIQSSCRVTNYIKSFSKVTRSFFDMNYKKKRMKDKQSHWVSSHCPNPSYIRARTHYMDLERWLCDNSHS